MELHNLKMEVFKGFSYGEDVGARKLIIEPRNEPPSLGRYFSCDDRKINSLINGKIYATAIDQLNDAFDWPSGAQDTAEKSDI